MKTRSRFLAPVGLAFAGALALLTPGCESSGDGGYNPGPAYYDPWYYGGPWYGGANVIVTPPVSRPGIPHPAPHPMPVRR